MPPEWTFGFWQSKISYKSAEEVLELTREMRRLQIPCDVVHLDTHWFKEDWYCDLEFDKERFPDPKGFVDELKAMGIRVSLWQLPYVPEGSAYFDDLLAAEGFVKNAEGGVYDCGICFTPGFEGMVGVIDFTSPGGVAVFKKHIARLLRLGAGVIKTDFGEAAPLDGIYADGTPGYEMHNLYPLLYNRAAFEATAETTGEGVVWARSAWAGSQRYPLHWGGDNSPDFSNIVPQLTGGLSLGLCGFPYWSQDIGGFCGHTNDLLLVRWMQFGMFLSHSRIHGFGDREIHRFQPQTRDLCVAAIRLRYRMMPYVLGSARKASEDCLPMARALVIEFQNDFATWGINDQYLFGESLLVAPIFTEDGKRSIYFPDGEWTCWWSGQVFEGRNRIETISPLDRIPVYLRNGALVPIGPVMNHTKEKPITELTVRVTRHLKAGSSRSLPLSVNGVPSRLEWSFDGRLHTLDFRGPAISIVVEPVGCSPGDIRVVRSAPF